jgi:hypothetical protein
MPENVGKYKPHSVLYSKINQKMKRSAITVIADATFRNQPPNCRQNSDLQILLHLVTFRYTCDRRMWHCGITVIAYLQIRLKPWAGLILTPQTSIILQQSATSAITVMVI